MGALGDDEALTSVNGMVTTTPITVLVLSRPPTDRRRGPGRRHVNGSGRIAPVVDVADRDRNDGGDRLTIGHRGDPEAGVDRMIGPTPLPHRCAGTRTDSPDGRLGRGRTQGESTVFGARTHRGIPHAKVIERHADHDRNGAVWRLEADTSLAECVSHTAAGGPPEGRAARQDDRIKTTDRRTGSSSSNSREAGEPPRISPDAVAPSGSRTTVHPVRASGSVQCPTVTPSTSRMAPTLGGAAHRRRSSSSRRSIRSAVTGHAWTAIASASPPGADAPAALWAMTSASRFPSPPRRRDSRRGGTPDDLRVGERIGQHRPGPGRDRLHHGDAEVLAFGRRHDDVGTIEKRLVIGPIEEPTRHHPISKPVEQRIDDGSLAAFVITDDGEVKIDPARGVAGPFG